MGNSFLLKFWRNYSLP